jgi:hypothetical protein
MSLSVSFLEKIGARDTIPDEHRVPEIKTSSLVTNRSTAKFVAQNGTSFRAGQTIYIRLNSVSQYLVPSSGALVFDVKVQNSAVDASLSNPVDASGVYLNPILDNIGAIFDKVRISVGGVQVEETQYLSRFINAMAYTSMSRAHYTQTGGMLYNAWKYNDDAVHNGIDLELTGLPSDRGLALHPWSAPSIYHKSFTWGQYWSEQIAAYGFFRMILPLSFFGSLFRRHSALNLRNIGNVEIQLTLSQDSDAIVNPGAVVFDGGVGATQNKPNCMMFTTGVSLGSPIFVVENVFVLADVLDMNPEYTSVIDALVNSEEGLVMPLETHTVLTATAALGTSTTASRKNLTYSFSTPMLKSVTYWSQLTSDLNNYNVFGCSGFRNLGVTETRLRIGQYWPQYDFQRSNEETAYMLQKAKASWGNISDESSVITRSGYGQGDTMVGQYVNSIPLTKYTESADILADGLDCRLSGSVITLEQSTSASGVDTTDASPTQLTFMAFEHVRVVRQSSGQLSVEES